MNKVITINLNGNAYQLEEDGFEALRRYLESAARQLDGNPDKAEIIADIEQSIGDKFRGLLGVNKTVVVTKEVTDVVAEMGPVQDATGNQDEPAGRATGAAASGPAPAAAVPHRRLFRILEGAKIGGVCNGLAAFFGIEVTIIRLLFVFVALTFGAGLLVYIIMMLVIPAAETPAEKTEAFGGPSTTEDFIRRAKAGYYDGFKTFGDKKAYREWKRQFKRDMRQNFGRWRHDWHQWGHPSTPREGSWIARSFVSLLITVVSIIGFCAILSLIMTGSVFTFGLPAGMPLWMGIILLWLIFRVIKWPLKAARYSLYYNGNGGPGYWGRGSCCSMWWIVAILVTVWLANHHSLRAHEALEQLRHQTHSMVNSLRDWWDRP